MRKHLNLLEKCSSVYLFCMLGIFPLYYQNKYFDMADAKFAFFQYATMAMIFIMTLLFAYYTFTQKTDAAKPDIEQAEAVKTSAEKAVGGMKLSAVDVFVLLYALAVVLSYVCSDYKAEAVYGYGDWYMGLFAQLCFVAIYFFISRFYKWKSWMLYVVLVSSAIVFLLGVLHRFLVDPLGLYEGIELYNAGVYYYYQRLFLSTIGQATWYACFLCLIYPIGIWAFLFADTKKKYILSAAYLCIAGATLVTQNGDAAYIGVFIACIIFFFYSLRDNRLFLRFMEMLLWTLLSTRIIGILQIIFKDRLVPLEPLSLFITQNNMLWILFAFLLLLYALLKWKMLYKGMEIANYKYIRKICIGILLIILVGAGVLMYLVTTDKLPQPLSFLKEIEYLHINHQWGNERGRIWKYTTEMFIGLPFLKKLVGIGPDCFGLYAYGIYAEKFQIIWGDTILTNAHNEILNILLNVGIFGAVSYIGIFVSSFKHFLIRMREHTFYLALAASVAAYLCHNLFMSQEIAATPILFCALGVGNAVLEKKNKKAVVS